LARERSLLRGKDRFPRERLAQLTSAWITVIFLLFFSFSYLQSIYRERNTVVAVLFASFFFFLFFFFFFLFLVDIRFVSLMRQNCAAHAHVRICCLERQL